MELTMLPLVHVTLHRLHTFYACLCNAQTRHA